MKAMGITAFTAEKTKVGGDISITQKDRNS